MDTPLPNSPLCGENEVQYEDGYSITPYLQINPRSSLGPIAPETHYDRHDTRPCVNRDRKQVGGCRFESKLVDNSGSKEGKGKQRPIAAHLNVSFAEDILGAQCLQAHVDAHYQQVSYLKEHEAARALTSQPCLPIHDRLPHVLHLELFTGRTELHVSLEPTHNPNTYTT